MNELPPYLKLVQMNGWKHIHPCRSYSVIPLQQALPA
jgi:hypothetical protein